MAYLELTEDQMVELLTEIQKLAREMMKTSKGVEVGVLYSPSAHRAACDAVCKKMSWLAKQGDIV